MIIYTSGSNWCISFSFCIITCSFACQFSLHYYWYCYNQKQSSGGVLLKRCSYKFRKIDMKTKDCTKDSFLMVLGLLSPRKFAPNPNSNTNRKLNPNPNRGSFPRGAIVRTPFSITLQIHRVYLYQKRDSETYVFFVNSAKFLITLFKEPCDGCFFINTRSVYCPTNELLFFQKRCHAYFPAEYFLVWIYRLGTRLTSIFKTLIQTPIFNPVEHLRLRVFFRKLLTT